MSPTLSDDLLVRDLHERADRVLPAMSLDLADVLVAGRHHRRRRTVALSAAGALAAGAFVVGAAQIWADEPVATPPAGVQQEPRPMGDGQTVELAPGVIAANRPVEMTLEDGTPVLDLGIGFPNAPATSRPLILMPITDDQLAEANASAEPHRVWDGGVQLAQVGESGPEVVSPWVWSSEEAAGDEGFRWDTVMRTVGEESGLYIGVLPAWLPDPRVVLYSRDGFLQTDGSNVHSLEVPVYPAPTDDGRLLYTVWIPAVADDVDGFATDVDATFAVGSDGTVVTGLGCATSTLDECAATFGPEISAAVDLVTGGIDTLTIETATDVRVIETDMGPATDLGVTVEDPQLVDPNQALTYVIRVTTVGEMAPEDAVLTPEEREGPAVLLSELAADGTTLRGAYVATSRATSDGSPMYMSGLSDHDVYVLGRLSPGSGATLELVVEHAAGAERTLIPAFRLPGLPEDFFFVALHHDKVTFTDWPTIYVELTAQDGAIRRWTLAGIELSEDAPKSTDVPADQG